MHPRERRTTIAGLSRREFLRRAGMTGIALPSVAAILAACGKSDGGGSEGGPTGPQIASPDNPVTLPLFDDIAPIGDGLSPEAGPLRIYNWNDYIYKKALNKFQDEFNVEVEFTQFTGMSEAISKVQNGTIEFDVFFPTIENLGKLAAAKLLQPLNRSYIPNFQNIWPQLQDPWYDKGASYAVPYTTWKTGIGYRADHIDDPGSLSMPFDVFWNPDLKGKVGLLDEYRETIGMAVLRNGGTDINTHDEAQIRAAGDALGELIDLVNVDIAAGDYQKLAEDTSWARLSWSGNMNYAQWYLPKGTTADVLGYYYPPQGGWEVSNDLMVVSSKARSPVLAHMFINFLLDIDNGLLNFGYEGFQPPFQGVNEADFLAAGYIPDNLKSTLVTAQDFEAGKPIIALPPDVDQLWQDVWAEFKAGV